MTSKRSRSRTRRQEQTACPRSPDAPVNWDRLRQIFGSLTCRRQPALQELAWSGIVVEAATPAELAEKTEEVLVQQGRKRSRN